MENSKTLREAIVALLAEDEEQYSRKGQLGIKPHIRATVRNMMRNQVIGQHTTCERISKLLKQFPE